MFSTSRLSPFKPLKECPLSINRFPVGMFFVSNVVTLCIVVFFGQKEADNALSKRLAEVNEELHKSQARNTALQKDLSSTAQVLRAEEAKTAELNNRLKELAAADTNQADAMNSLTAKLQEATARISELQKMFTDVENQLKDSQVIQMQKDKEIQVCHGYGFFRLHVAVAHVCSLYMYLLFSKN